ncbi:zinc finger and SCAN domain-containing protein 2-like isoform X3 [Clupea harengus]|uniref:Zinc finger and SCAN domain-containing protein 2-like isoform X3 n=1 Tax=Clupea harengus TaxID=7950 RepID=A0A6P8ESQ0_CLUHA|nr:zinc finger and SCAN domain-containing protein 2-like isoform X3 [Clupea harengus]
MNTKMKYSRCNVVGCTDPHRSVHNLPISEGTRGKWVDFIFEGNVPGKIGKTLLVCANHFKLECFTNLGQFNNGLATRLTLQAGSLPSIRRSTDKGDASTARVHNKACQTDQAKMCTVGTQLCMKTLRPHYKSTATQTPAVTHISLDESVDFMASGAKKTMRKSRDSKCVSSFMLNRDTLVSEAVVQIASLLQLFQRCLGCCSQVCRITTRRDGPVLHVVQQCWTCRHRREWASHPPDHLFTDSHQAAEESVERSCEGIDIDMEEEMTEEEEEEEEQEQEEQKSKRKRNDSDAEWAPNIEEFVQMSGEESGSEEEEEGSPLLLAWCRDCGEESSTCCSEQDHRQLYCCVQCGYREDHQGPACTDGQETQNMDNPKAPTASNDVSELSSSKEQGSVNSSAQGVDTTEGQEDTSSSDQDNNTTSQLESSNSCHQEATVSKETHNIPMFAIYFRDLYSLQSHVEQSHGFKRELCPDCGKFIIRRDSRCSHVCDHKIKPFSCLTCGRCFTSPAGLHMHSQVHTEGHALPCRYCYKTFRFQEDKLRHEKIHLEERLKYRCPDCPKRFTDRYSRSAHRKTHWKHGRFFCKVCDKGFADFDHLKRHEVVHTGLKSYTCEQCDRSFNQPGNLKSHMRVHTGQKPFKCQDCGQCFNHNVSLKNHMQRHHRPKGDEGNLLFHTFRSTRDI